MVFHHLGRFLRAFAGALVYSSRVRKFPRKGRVKMSQDNGRRDDRNGSERAKKTNGAAEYGADPSRC